MTPVSQVTLEILNNRFTGIVTEMGRNIWRSSFTPFVKEAWDFGMGLVTCDGEMFAYSKDIGVSFMVAAPFEQAVRVFDDLVPGDVVISNDPYLRSGGLASHLPDIQLLKPIFHDGRIVCFVWTFIHSSDVGGIAPGSISPTATDIHQEGLRIPPLKLYRAGELNTDVMDLFLANSRIPLPNRGDLNALNAAMNVAEDRMAETIDRYGIDVVEAARDQVLDYAETVSREIITRIPDGSYRFHDYLELDMIDMPPARISVAATVRGDEMTIDYTGTDPQVRAAMNLATFGRNHHFLTGGLAGFFLSLSPHAPLNKGLWRPIRVVIPEGTILTPVAPAPVGVRFATGLRALETLLGALSQACEGTGGAQAVAGVIPAAEAGIGGVMAMSVFDEETGERIVNVVSPLGGGSGARPGKDAVDGVGILAGFTRNIPAEVIETELPVVLRHYRLADEAPAAGEFRGGLGRDMCVEAIVPDSVLTARGWERNVFRPWGRRGGAPGSLSRIIVDEGTGRERHLGKIDVLRLQPGETVRMISAGGGGFGEPLQRAPEAVLADVLNEYIDAGHAEQVYGVLIDGHEIDYEGTARKRRELRSRTAPAPGEFAVGSERLAFEREFPPEFHDELLAELHERVRPELRHYYLVRAYEIFRATGGDRAAARAVLPRRADEVAS
ncbi:hydantoinase B/oxoprolinase family protein [Amycolatopsis jejuensis]|uniref:hydantoinase B/oxoprolinase family protein n=1 Tax=Amycolatopsis jejuensis TaxID=330084 RepID=UPI00068D01D4|nr:hydantoinase B/oxoprolinase family protein [Amycolatopsis jejuensis]